MGRRLSLDTSVLVGLERGRLAPSILAADDDVCLSIIVVAEYMTGIELALPTYRSRMCEFLDRIVEHAVVLPVDEDILDVLVSLRTWTHLHGCPRGQHDLIIAATALTTQRTLMTLDTRAKFHELPGIRVDILEYLPRT